MKVIKTHPLKDEITLDLTPFIRGFGAFLATGQVHVGAFFTGYLLGRNFRR